MSKDSILGKMLDEYRLEELLGHGGMARVYRGVDTNINRHVAIKVIDSPYRADSEYTLRFKREAQAIAQLTHPNIVNLYRYGEAEGVLYMAMQYIQGVDLGAILDGYREDGTFMEFEDVQRIIREIGGALDYVHEHGIIHRDMKPSNIMLDRDGRAILTDFGLALMTDIGTHGEIFGSPHYIAPEQAISSAGAVPQSDIYGLGVVLFEMLTNQLPFESEHPMDLAMMHMSDAPPKPRSLRLDIPEAVERVILTALEKDPNDRYQSGAAMADDLAKALLAVPEEGPTVVSRHITIPERVALDLDRNPLPPLPAAVQSLGAIDDTQESVLDLTQESPARDAPMDAESILQPLDAEFTRPGYLPEQQTVASQTKQAEVESPTVTRPAPTQPRYEGVGTPAAPTEPIGVEQPYYDIQPRDTTLWYMGAGLLGAVILGMLILGLYIALTSGGDDGEKDDDNNVANIVNSQTPSPVSPTVTTIMFPTSTAFPGITLTPLILLPTATNQLPTSTQAPTLTQPPSATLFPTNTHTATWTPTVTYTSSPTFTPTLSPTPGEDAEYSLALDRHSDESLYIKNNGTFAIPMADFQLIGITDKKGDPISVSGSDWGISELGPNECVTVWKDKSDKAPDMTCTLVGNRVDLKKDDIFWQSAFDLVYKGQTLTTCSFPNDDERCRITWKVNPEPTTIAPVVTSGYVLNIESPHAGVLIIENLSTVDLPINNFIFTNGTTVVAGGQFGQSVVNPNHCVAIVTDLSASLDDVKCSIVGLVSLDAEAFWTSGLDIVFNGQVASCNLAEVNQCTIPLAN